MPLQRRTGAIGLLLMTIVMGVQPAKAQTKLRFTLDWIPGATHGAFPSHRLTKRT